MGQGTRTFNRGAHDEEIEVEFTISPVIPEQGPTYACGGQPAEGGEVEITSATLVASGQPVELTPDEIERFSTEIAENAEDYFDDGPEPDDWRGEA